LFLYVCLFQELGVHGSFTKIDEFSLEMIPFDSDLLSMEMEYSFRVCFCAAVLIGYTMHLACLSICLSVYLPSLGCF